MAVMFSQEDIGAYKVSMARHAAKNNFLVEKWTKFRNKQIADLSKLFEQTPSPARDSYQLVLEKARDVAELILKDLSYPADMYISEFEMRNCK